MPEKYDNHGAKIPDEAGAALIQIARAEIAGALDVVHASAREDYPWLQQQGACFVTLTQQQKLRGCIGTLEAYRTLLLDVKANAYAAAFRDTRFPPLTAQELNDTKIEISLLSAMQPLTFSTEHDAWAQLRPNIDGVVFEFGRYRSTFLPQVWEQIPDVKTFMAHLKHKAGLTPEFWNDEVKLIRYTVRKWKEQDL